MIFVLLFSFTNTVAQQPAYFSFAEEQFRGVQIYDVIQDKNLNYWFATNEGLFYFDYYTYEKIECDKAKGSSVFNFVMSKNGTIYCHNLNNQVFEIRGKELNLFYELEKDERSSDLSISVADNENVVIGAKKIIVINKLGKKINQFNAAEHYIGPPFINSKLEIQFHIHNSDTVVIFSNGKFSIHKILIPNYPKNSVLKFYKIENETYALNLQTKEQFSYNQLQFKLNPINQNSAFSRSESIRVYETQKNIWIAGTLPGVTLLNNQNKESILDVFYPGYYISDVFKDREGNILLSTFDKGILVIPDLNIPDVINTFYDDPITSLYSDSEMGLIMGSSKGKLLNYINGKINSIDEQGKRPIEILRGDKEGSYFLFDNGKIRIYNKKIHTIKDVIDASLKDVTIDNHHTFYFGTNRGIRKLIQKNNGDDFESEIVASMNQRIYSLDYNFHDSCLYTSTASGLYAIFASGITKKILLNNEDIFPNDLTYYNHKTYACTKKNGLLVLQNGKIIQEIKTLVNENNESIKKIIFYKNTIIAKSSNGLFQFDLNGNLLKSINSIFGFSSKRIIDFTIHENQLWVSHSGGVQKINLSYSKQFQKKPIIRIDKILVNDSLIEPSGAHLLNSDSRKVQFIFSTPTIKNHQTIRYHYKLIGYDEKWNTNNYDFNSITYSALAPGDYTFYLKVENQGKFSEPLSYSFSISTPFYLRWWFITVLIIIFLATVYFIYKWQLKIQQKKSQQINELNASKLTAIQSQMNPHFIFNSLNSIQDLILKGDVEHSYSYITTFSNLVRRTLNYSEKDFIDFEQEIKLLELYLSLEKLRFKKEINYNIEIKAVEDVMIPPLLIQPFIENSLIHGLLHKEGQKELTITFELKDVLICTIEDNGVGRAKAKTIKERQRSEHESFSGKAIHKRFEILSNVFNGDFGYVYEDLYENGEPIGTKVVLSIPVKHKF